MIYTYTKPKHGITNVLAILLFVNFFLRLSEGFSWRSILYIAIAGVLLTTEGVQLDVAKKRYRKTIAISNFHFGKWHTLVNVEKVIIESAKNMANRSEHKINDLLVQVSFDNQIIRVYSTENHSYAHNTATEISTALNVSIDDKTIENVI
ncbi:hypothetical protein [Flavobacterium sp.]|uniref:hypothetical protein n=1 Tax=Flavobacterium sp. TaxID=239 RepID=UPI00262AA2A5|nr:hypothetical protein [Flavobacterium sp.]